MAAGVYLHIPFCKSRCSYCDFATDVYRDSDTVERYVDALCMEIASWQPSAKIQADSVYFGGGTPSLLNARQVEHILGAVHDAFSIEPDAEVTMEMNPATVTTASLSEYRDLGVNRASFGVQTFNDRELKLLARGHDANDARATFEMLRSAGYDNISLDLIAGLPGQSVRQWRRNIAEAIAMAPEHLSLYLLEVHEGTPLAEQIRSGRRPAPDDDTAAEMYEIMVDELDAAGYEQYEISNFAREGRRSRHNSKYWLLDPVYGFGVSAHSFDGTERYANHRDTNRYVELVESGTSPVVTRESADEAAEYTFLRLRMKHGVSLSEFEQRFGYSLIDKKGGDIDSLTDAGLVEITAGSLRLTRRGKLFSNVVFAAFI
jgi:oxygen-independent coproporphyrinogen-3 oxidase